MYVGPAGWPLKEDLLWGAYFYTRDWTMIPLEGHREPSGAIVLYEGDPGTSQELRPMFELNVTSGTVVSGTWKAPDSQRPTRVRLKTIPQPPPFEKAIARSRTFARPEWPFSFAYPDGWSLQDSGERFVLQSRDPQDMMFGNGLDCERGVDVPPRPPAGAPPKEFRGAFYQSDEGWVVASEQSVTTLCDEPDSDCTAPLTRSDGSATFMSASGAYRSHNPWGYAGIAEANHYLIVDGNRWAFCFDRLLDSPDRIKLNPSRTGKPLPAAWLAGIDRDVRAGSYGNVDAIAVMLDGRVVFNQRYARSYQDISRGRVGPLGCGEGCTDRARMDEFNYYHPRWHPYYLGRGVHTLQSVTKTIAATVIGIALGRGDIRSLDQPFLDFFKDRDLSRVDPRLRRASLTDLLTMRSGIEWHENDRPMDETNTTLQLERSSDWIAFTLNQPMDADPGTKWVYNSGGSELMAGIIRSATGRHIDEYAEELLFKPLGIQAFHWKKTPTGHPDTEGGLYLSAPDLAKIGELYLRDGMWNGRRVLPKGWVALATKRHAASAAPGWDYGLQWWITSRNGVDVWAGRGFGGQLLIVIPARSAVAVVNAWNIFGGRAANIFDPLVAAMFDSPP